jgi:prophage regulatory protein
VTNTANVCIPSASTPLAGIDEILVLLVRISRERVRELTFRSDFPEPAAELAGGDVWHRADVEAWIDEHGDAVADMLKRTR